MVFLWDLIAEIYIFKNLCYPQRFQVVKDNKGPKVCIQLKINGLFHNVSVDW